MNPIEMFTGVVTAAQKTQVALANGKYNQDQINQEIRNQENNTFNNAIKGMNMIGSEAEKRGDEIARGR